MLFDGEAFGRWLDLDEIMGGEPPDGISALIQKGRERYSLPLHAPAGGKAM